jgi:hypothetical protein
VIDMEGLRLVKQEQSPQLAARKKFGRYKGESAKQSRELQLSDDPKLARLIDVWRALEFETRQVAHPPLLLKQFSRFEIEFEKTFRAVSGLSCSSDELGRFIVMLPELIDEEHSKVNLISPFALVKLWMISYKAGLFISALVYSGPDQEYEVSTSALPVSPSCLGFFNTKHLKVYGNSGPQLGHSMAAGKLELIGDADINAGTRMLGGTMIISGKANSNIGNRMTGGSIVCKSDATSPIGLEMQGGRIIVEGDIIPHSWPDSNSPAKQVVGERMTGGEIHLEGKYKKTSGLRKRMIFHNGKLIWDE